jgi:glycosyltransferase involved in cell wall biosynthesis
MTISVLMSVYRSEEADFFNAAIKSVWTNQTVKPMEIVLVEDGPLPDGLHHVIERWKSILGNKFVVLRNEKNLGLTKSLNRGLNVAHGELIARMDSDDICLPDRFEKQLAYLEAHPEVDIVGGQMTEFIDTPDNIIGRRDVPLTNEEIYDYMKSRCALNHVTVMFRKEAVLKVGNYQDWFWNEDYYLWVRMMKAGCKFANIPDVAVNVRSGADQYARRGGKKYFDSEIGIKRLMLKEGMITRTQFLINYVERFIIQLLLPNSVRGWVFRTFARKK